MKPDVRFEGNFDTATANYNRTSKKIGRPLRAAPEGLTREQLWEQNFTLNLRETLGAMHAVGGAVQLWTLVANVSGTEIRRTNSMVSI
jgi:hypothetical protein